MLSTSTMNKMLNAEAVLEAKTYTINDLLVDLKQSVFTELASRKPIDIYRRNLQKAYVERLGALINPHRLQRPLLSQAVEVQRR